MILFNWKKKDKVWRSVSWLWKWCIAGKWRKKTEYIYRKGTNEGKVAFGVSFLSRRGARRVQKKGTHCRSPRTASFAFFSSFLLFFSASQFLCCIFFSCRLLRLFSVLNVLTRINFNRMPQQISNRSTPRFLFCSSHTKKEREKPWKLGIQYWAVRLVVGFSLLCLFFSFIFLLFFTAVEDLVARRVFSFFFFIFNPSLLPQYRPSPTVEMHKCQNDTRCCPLFTPALSFSRY